MDASGAWLAFDIGCIECGEDSGVIGVFASEGEARAAADVAEERQRAGWHGQHEFAVYFLPNVRLTPESEAQP